MDWIDIHNLMVNFEFANETSGMDRVPDCAKVELAKYIADRLPPQTCPLCEMRGCEHRSGDCG